MNLLHKKPQMSFDLKISFDGFEIKSGHFDIQSFLGFNNQTAQLIDSICTFKFYVNFAETIVDGIEIKGDIENAFNHRLFVHELKTFQAGLNSKWRGYFMYRDSKNNYTLHAPNFDDY